MPHNWRNWMAPALVFSGEIEGEFGKENLPTAIDLKIKAGAQIMMLNNDVRRALGERQHRGNQGADTEQLKAKISSSPT